MWFCTKLNNNTTHSSKSVLTKIILAGFKDQFSSERVVRNEVIFSIYVDLLYMKKEYYSRPIKLREGYT